MEEELVLRTDTYVQRLRPELVLCVVAEIRPARRAMIDARESAQQIEIEGDPLSMPKIAPVEDEVTATQFPGFNLAGDDQLLELSGALDRKSTRLNSSHLGISYAVFCLK